MSMIAEKWQENPMWEGRCLKCGGPTEPYLDTELLLCQRCGRVFDPSADDGDKEIITARCPDCGGPAIEVSPSGEFVCLKCGLIFAPGEPINAKRQKLNLKAFAAELVARARKLAKAKKGKPKSEPPNRSAGEIYAARAEARHAAAKPEGTRK